jgi:hypothetical protein
VRRDRELRDPPDVPGAIAAGVHVQDSGGFRARPITPNVSRGCLSASSTTAGVAVRGDRPREPDRRRVEGIDGRTSFPVDDRQLPRVSSRIFFGQALHHVRRAQSVLEQLDRLGTVQAVGRRLSRYRADARNCIRHRSPRAKGVGLNRDAEVIGYSTATFARRRSIASHETQ